MPERPSLPAAILGLLLACGVALGGYWIGNGLLRARAWLARILAPGRRPSS